jgi:hypothetical protein
MKDGKIILLEENDQNQEFYFPILGTETKI